MKPASFDYHAPDEAAGVVSLLSDYGEDAKILAGGQSLVPMLNLRLTRFEVLVDIGRVKEWHSLSVTPSGVTVGAGVRQCDIEAHPEVATSAPLLARAVPYIGHFQIRSRGTVCGSIAHADPAAECPAVVLALDGQLEMTGPDGKRTVAAKDFFTGTWATVLDPSEVLTSVTFPTWGPGSGFAVEEVARRHGDFAIAGACAGIQVTDGVIGKAAISVFGLDSTPLRTTEAESALVGLTLSDLQPKEIGQLAVRDLEPPGDLHASTELRRRIGATVVGRAVTKAAEEASRG